MTMSGSPLEQTSGKLTISYFVYVSVPDADVIEEASRGLKPLLQLGVEESSTGRATGVRIAACKDELPPAGSGYKGWAVAVTVLADLDRWNEALGPEQTGADVIRHVSGVIEAIDISEAAGAAVDRVEAKGIIRAPR
jgi:hypothetical protein